MIQTPHITLLLGTTTLPTTEKANEKEAAILQAIKQGACVSYQIAKQAKVSESYTKQILRRMVADGLVQRRIVGHGGQFGKKHIYTVKP